MKRLTARRKIDSIYLIVYFFNVFNCFASECLVFKTVLLFYSIGPKCWCAFVNIEDSSLDSLGREAILVVETILRVQQAVCAETVAMLLSPTL